MKFIHFFLNFNFYYIPAHEEFYKQPIFYALGHFSRFLPSESTRLNIKGKWKNNIHVTAFIRPDEMTTLILYNS
jgi:glucosylceramidase